MTAFFRFPHTPHLAWLGAGRPRQDKVLSPAEANALLSDTVTVEEKLDGANFGISVDEGDRLCVQNRGQYLLPPFSGQFSKVAGWLQGHEHKLRALLADHLILFGEWCAARHSVAYDQLPDWFIAFDIYDPHSERFWSVSRRDARLADIGLAVAPALAAGKTTLSQMVTMTLSGVSRFGTGPLEGIVIRRDKDGFLEQRAKLVRPDFIQDIDSHWRSRRIEWNHIRYDGAGGS